MSRLGAGGTKFTRIGAEDVLDLTRDEMALLGGHYADGELHSAAASLDIEDEHADESPMLSQPVSLETVEGDCFKRDCNIYPSDEVATIEGR